MANVRKVEHGSGKIAWRATVTTSQGKRRSKNFPRKGDAEAWIRANDGASASGSASMTFLDLARAHGRHFDALVKAGERGQRTSDGYDSHIRIHLKDDALAKRRLSEINTPTLQEFLQRVIDKTGSVETGRRVKRSLSAWCAHAQLSGWMTANPAQACKIVKKRRRRAEARVQIPAKAALSALLKAAGEGPAAQRDSAVVHVLLFGGLRISELLGAADDAIEVRRNGGAVSVHERLCSRHVTLGEVKSDDGLREVPIGGSTSTAVRAWRLARGPSPGFRTPAGAFTAGRLFPAPPDRRFGSLWSYSDFRRDCWNPLMDRAGLAEVRMVETVTRGKTHRHKRIAVAFSPHDLRHAYASIQIENRVTPKRLQEMMGHATLAMTMDLYGHLWTDEEADQALADAAERTIPRIG